MASEWRNGKLGDCILLQSGGTPSKSRSEFWGGDTPWVSAKDMKSFWIDDSEDHLTEQGVTHATRLVEAGTTLMLVRGMTLHNDVPICRVRRPATFNQDVKAVIARSGTYTDFVPYLLLGNKQRLLSIVDSAGHGTGRFNTETLLRLPVGIPPLKEQQAIACILGALDDKIELNRRMSKTLEEMTRAIFKSWFVDFDPVRAKAAGRRPLGLKPEIASLFPDTFEDSELGQIPNRWRVRPIGDLVRVLGGGTPSTTEPAYWEGGMHPFCTPKDMSSLADPVLLQTERHLTDDGLAKVSSGQLPVGTVLLSSRAPIGYLAIAETPVSINQGIIAMVCDGELPNLYVLYWTSANMERVIANANGSTFLEISKQNFRPITAVIPQRDILGQFTRIVGPLHQRLASSLRQTRHLAAIRDALLPKLISGVLRVPDVGRIVGRCV